MARGEHSTGPAPNDRMATKRLLRRKLKVAVMTALGHQLPRGLARGAAALPFMTDTKANGRRRRNGPIAASPTTQ
jgi:hypothetical protein